MSPVGSWNFVRGTGGRWVYGLMLRNADDSMAVTASERTGRRRSITLEGCSPYRTTTLAREMGDKREGYETAMRKAIKEHK